MPIITLVIKLTKDNVKIRASIFFNLSTKI